MSLRVNNPDYLIGKWDLRNNAIDNSGYEHDGTWSGTEAYSEGPYRRRSIADFDGASYVSITDPYSSSLSIFSLSINVISDSSAAIRYIFGHTGNVFDSRFNVGGALQIYTTGLGAWTNVLAGAVPNKYYHIVYTYDSDIWNVYVDGVLEYTSGSVVESLDGNFRIGSNVAGTTFMDGKIFNAKLYNINLTYDEAKYLKTYDRGH